MQGDFTVVHAVGGVCWICLTLDISLMQQGFTPMYFASKTNHPRLVELLLAHGADINKVQQCIVASAAKNLDFVLILGFLSMKIT